MRIDQFEKLPLLLRSRAVERITGLTRKELAVLRDQGALKFMRLRREVRYYRESVRELVGIQPEEPNGIRR